MQNMSLARAFTKRSKRPSDGQIKRNLISSPVALISTTNMLSYNAPDLPNPTLKAISSSNASFISKKSLEDSDATMSSPELTDASSVDSGSPISPRPNHLSNYFASANGMSPVTAPPPRAPRKSASTTSLNTVPQSPAIPQRAVSHSKQAHEQIARQRSMHSMNSRSSHGSQTSHQSHLSQPSTRSLREQRSSTDMFRLVEEPSHPFGKELEQLKEVVEEFGGVIAEAEMDEDMIFMRSHGLAKFEAGDYLNEIQPLFGRAFNAAFDRRLVAAQEAPAWI